MSSRREFLQVSGAALLGSRFAHEDVAAVTTCQPNDQEEIVFTVHPMVLLFFTGIEVPPINNIVVASTDEKFLFIIDSDPVWAVKRVAPGMHGVYVWASAVAPGLDYHDCDITKIITPDTGFCAVSTPKQEKDPKMWPTWPVDKKEVD